MLVAASLLARASLVVLVLLAPAGSAAEGEFAVRIQAPERLREILVQHLEISRWQGHERMDAAEFKRLYRNAPKEIADLLATEGYYRPVIESALDESAGRLLARFTIDPGEPVQVASVQIEVTGALPAHDPDAGRKIERLRAAWPLAAGAVFRHAEWEQGKRGLLRSLALDRYPLAAIAKSEAIVDPGKRTAIVSVVVDSGPAVRFGELRIEGLARYPRSIVENLNPIRAGEAYSNLQLQEFQSRLLDSGYFTSVTVDAAAEPSGVAPVRVWVEEREARRIAFGIGYSTDTGARVQAEYRQLNLLEHGLQLGARVKLESRARSARTDLFFPTDATGYRHRLIAETERKDVQGTETDKVVLTAGRARRRGDIETDVSINYIAEEERIAGIGRESRMALTGNWSYTIRRTNHPLFPDRGYLLNVQLGGAPGILVAEQSFFRIYGRSVHYFKMGEQGVLSVRAQLGAVLSRGTSDVPSDFRFRTGGDQSVRGYAFESLGVRRGSAVVGGRALALAGAEYTHWINEDWGAAVFVDAGNAADDFRGFHLAQGYGVGARWRSPVGPLNLDLAYGADARKLRLHFSVGLAF
ncbi:MAG: outer membrane protein assembly factor [Burkholderiales bacterium]|nr:outer membrane protein assembly factor [Burkholderiales bacterium]